MSGPYTHERQKRVDLGHSLNHYSPSACAHVERLAASNVSRRSKSFRSVTTERKFVIVRSSAQNSAIPIPDLRLRGANFGYRMDSRPVHLDEHERLSATRFARTGTNQRAVRSDPAIAVSRRYRHPQRAH